MTCVVCLDTIIEKNILCGNDHLYHHNCFNRCDKQKCLICFQYVTYVFDDILTEGECENMISRCTETKDIKNNRSYALNDLYIYGKLNSATKDLYACGTRLYQNLKFTKYENNSLMPRYKDNKYYNSEYAIHIFLNDTYGGEMKLYNDTTSYDIEPKAGRVIITHYDSEYEILPVTNGKMYTIKTDLIAEIPSITPLTINRRINVRYERNRELMIRNNRTLYNRIIRDGEFSILDRQSRPTHTRFINH